MNFLSVIIEELLPFVRGTDLLALALTCQTFKERIFQSKRWKALPLIKDIEHSWNYGLLVVSGYNIESLKHHQNDFHSYFETGLPIEIKLCCNFDYSSLIQSKPLWLSTVLKMKISIGFMDGLVLKT